MEEFRNWKKGSDASLDLDFLNLLLHKFIPSSRVTLQMFTEPTPEQQQAICQ